MNDVSTVLRIEDLSTGGQWELLEAGPDLDADYRDVTGWDHPDPSAGLCLVAARLAFTRGRPMPPGGVLLGIDIDPYRSPPQDGRFEYRVDSEVTPHRSGLPMVRIVTTLRLPEGAHVAEVAYAIRWPHE